jgi:UDP:flavonoid glycosyltransferase YjiC (YdhE family)
MVPLLAAARRRGDDVLVVAPPALRDMVSRAGYEMQAGDEPPESDIAPIRELLPTLPAHEASVLGNRDLFARLAADAMLPRVDDVCATWKPDIVLRDPCEYASAVVAETRGLRMAQVAISLADNELGSIDAAGPALAEHHTGLVAEIVASPYLTRFPESLDPSSFPTTLRYHEVVDDAPAPLPAWWDGSAPFVYLTLGTVLGRMTHAVGVYRALLRSVSGLPVRVLLTVGRHFDAATLGELPANTHVEAWVDQGRVLPHADLVVCHGGSGTLFGALAAGVPVVAVPLFADQFANARRAADAGAGVVVEVEQHGRGNRTVIGERDSRWITAAIETALSTPSLPVQAHRIADEVRATPTPEETVAALASS